MITTSNRKDKFLNMRLTDKELNTFKALATIKKKPVNRLLVELVYKELKKEIDSEMEKYYTYLMAEGTLAKDWDSDADKVWDRYWLENAPTK